MPKIYRSVQHFLQHSDSSLGSINNVHLVNHLDSPLVSCSLVYCFFFTVVLLADVTKTTSDYLHATMPPLDRAHPLERSGNRAQNWLVCNQVCKTSTIEIKFFLLFKKPSIGNTLLFNNIPSKERNN